MKNVLYLFCALFFAASAWAGNVRVTMNAWGAGTPEQQAAQVLMVGLNWGTPSNPQVFETTAIQNTINIPFTGNLNDLGGAVYESASKNTLLWSLSYYAPSGGWDIGPNDTLYVQLGVYGHTVTMIRGVPSTVNVLFICLAAGFYFGWTLFSPLDV